MSLLLRQCTNQKKTVYNSIILNWGNYGDGEYTIKNTVFPMNLYIAVGLNSRIQKRCTILQAGDVIAIPYLGGAVEIQFINKTTRQKMVVLRRVLCPTTAMK